jgi:hypothetical protein
VAAIPGIVGKQVRRVNRNTLIVSALIGGLVVWGGWEGRDAWGVLVFLGLVGVLPVWFVYLTVVRMVNPRRHPVYTRLERFGEPERIAMELEEEYGDGTGVHRIGRAEFTKGWLIHRMFLWLDLMRLGDVMRVYEKVSTTRTKNGNVSNRTYAAVVADREDNDVTMWEGQKKVEEIVGYVAGRMPWVVVGDEFDVKMRWLDNRKNFAKLVERRKAAHEAGERMEEVGKWVEK